MSPSSTHPLLRGNGTQVDASWPESKEELTRSMVLLATLVSAAAYAEGSVVRRAIKSAR